MRGKSDAAAGFEKTGYSWQNWFAILRSSFLRIIIALAILSLGGNAFPKAGATNDSSDEEYEKKSYEELVDEEQKVESRWVNVMSIYQRRIHLIPDLLALVKKHSGAEDEVIQALSKAESEMARLQVTTETINVPAEFRRYQQAQNDIARNLSRLMRLIEKFPPLKKDQELIELLNRLEGVENRIAVERMRFNDAAQAFNTKVAKLQRKPFPGLNRFKKKSYFGSEVGE